MGNKNLEDKIDDAIAELVEGVCLEILKHGWTIADRLFKIASWTLMVGAIGLLYDKMQNNELLVTNYFLIALLFIGVLTSIMNGMIYCQDKMVGKFNKLSHGWYLFTMMAVGCVIMLVGFFVVLPAITSGIKAILETFSNG